MIESLAGTDLRLTNAVWPFAETRRAEIAAHWAEALIEKPAMFDGRVLGALNPQMTDGVLSASVIETSFSAFLAWRDWGFADETYFNAFGSAVIAGNDGGYIFGVMGAHTSNAGAIYPCGGSLEPDDVGADGKVDIWASTARELAEETGLLAAEATLGGDFLVRWGQLMSFTRIYRFDMPVAALARRIEVTLAAQDEPELAGITVFKTLSDLDPKTMRPYALLTAKYLLDVK
jgi:8-oxo-dGTP pyrophosphatase MutT (NUDIX family)